MKKFYESPVVEITVFDVEDVIATSNVVSVVLDTINTENDSKVTEAIEAINNATYTNKFRKALRFDANWKW